MSDKPTHISRARELRQKLTEAEKRLWNYLRNRKFHNLKFLRQHPVIYQTTNNQVQQTKTNQTSRSISNSRPNPNL